MPCLFTDPYEYLYLFYKQNEFCTDDNEKKD